MTVTLYQVSINPIVVDKSLGTGTDKTCTIKDTLDIINPVIELDYDATILSKNYMYISDLGRYYFIRNIEIVNHVIVITGHVDVLKTYGAQIKASNVTATRSNYGNKQLNDNMVISQSDEYVEYRKLGNSFTGETYVLILGG